MSKRSERGRGVLVTGGSGGIGTAVAEAFAARGDRVAVHYGARRSAAEWLAAALPGEGHVALGADLTDADAVRGLVDDAAAALGGLDVLVNNAGTFLHHPPVEVEYEAWQEVWARTLAVNLVAAANAMWCAVRHMRTDAGGRGGRIVNVSSRGAFRGEPNSPAYGASKAGLNALGQSMAVALAPYGIGVATVAPGWVETQMASRVLDGPQGPAARAQSPFGRAARPDEVAAAVVFLADPGAEFTSGAILDVNGASYLRT
jgi:NAD(P)-dependent dehydrogenase (short-subunit alcohol dehydrogenase family)